MKPAAFAAKLMSAVMISGAWLVLLPIYGCATNYKTTVIHAQAQGDVRVHGRTENLTEGGVQANAKANGIENAGLNQ